MVPSNDVGAELVSFHDALHQAETPLTAKCTFQNKHLILFNVLQIRKGFKLHKTMNKPVHWIRHNIYEDCC